jgi:predicted transcriptional regulator
VTLLYEALNRVGTPTPVAEPLTPAVPIRKSVFPSYIVCLEDGKKLKMLKRHLQASYGMTPADYRAKWGLPDSYPMTAPDYAAHRSALAKENGLGCVPVQPAVEVLVQKIAEGVRGRKPGRKKAAAAEAAPEISE